MVGAQVLAGWPAPAFGHTSVGPRAPSVAALLAHGLSQDIIDDVVDNTFRLYDSHPPMLLRGLGPRLVGELRPAVHAAFAALVMYFEERQEAGEMTAVATRLRQAVREAFPGEDAGQRLRSWGDWIRNEFKLENAHLFSRREAEGFNRVAECVSDLGREVGRLVSSHHKLHARLSALEAVVTKIAMSLKSSTVVEGDI